MAWNELVIITATMAAIMTHGGTTIAVTKVAEIKDRQI